MDALERGFIPIPIEAIEDPTQAVKTANKKNVYATSATLVSNKATAKEFNNTADSRKLGQRYKKGRDDKLNLTR